MIIQSLQWQMAQRAGMQVQPAELQQFANQIAQQNGMTLDQFRLQLAQDGIPFEIFLDDLRKEITTTRFREAFVTRRIQISEKEVESLVQAMDSENQIEYHLGHILIAADESSDEQTIANAKQHALDTVQRINTGCGFF